MSDDLKKEYSKDTCRVFVRDKASGHSNESPYPQCAIICGTEKPPTLMTSFVFKGTLAECREFVNINCEKTI